MTKQFTEYLKRQETPLKNAIADLVRIPSVLDETDPSYPFGVGVHQALQKAVDIAADLGLRTWYDSAGYYAWAEIGQGAEMLGVLGHVDVVPAGNPENWQTPPFEPSERQGKLYGRGVQDDKGPMMAALFAVKALMDAGVSFNKRVRFIFGGDEENHWRGINRYMAREEIPSLGFTPDAEFPLIFAEKSILQVVLSASNDVGAPSMSLGSAFNAVPGEAVYTGPHQWALIAQLKDWGFDFLHVENGVKVLGKAAHASLPENGVNAIVRLALAADAAGIPSRAMHFLAQTAGKDYYAEAIFGPLEDDVSGKLTFNVGKLIITPEEEQLCLDMRIPVTTPKDAVVPKLQQAAAKFGLRYQEHAWKGSLYVPLDHPLVKTLLKVYREETGDAEAEPIAIGGGTYARAMPNCVAFGPNFPGSPETAHQANEFIVIDEMNRAMAIYAAAIYELTR